MVVVVMVVVVIVADTAIKVEAIMDLFPILFLITCLLVVDTREVFFALF